MAVKKNKIETLILCIDRDDDVGRKTSYKGPVVGREANLKMATALALADPQDADANTVFEAVRTYDNMKKKGERVDVITLTGHYDVGVHSDRIISEQLDRVLGKFKAKKAATNPAKNLPAFRSSAFEKRNCIPLSCTKQLNTSSPLVFRVSMGKIWSAYEAIIDNCFNVELIIGVLVLSVVQLIAFGVLFFLGLLLLGVSAFLGPLALLLAVVVAGLGLVLSMAFFGGLYFNLGYAKLEQNKVDFGSAFQNTLAHLFQAFKLWLAWWVLLSLVVGVFALVVGLSFLPSLASLGQQIQGGAAPSEEAVLGSLGGGLAVFFLLFFAFLVLLIVIAPFTTVLFSLPFVEGTGVRASLARALELGKKNYWPNFKLMVLHMLVSSATFSAFYLVALLLMIPVLALGGVAAMGFGFMLVYYLSMLLASVFLAVLSALYQARVYLYDVHG